MLRSARSSWTAQVCVTVAALALLGLSAAASRPGPAGQASTARPTDRGMHVTVLDKDGAPVAGLVAADFVVREDSVIREVLRAERATDPITIALLVDTSQSATASIADIRRALKPFVKRMAGRNPIAIMAFGERPSTLATYTLDAATLDRSIDRLFAVSGSGSYLLEAVGEASKGLAKQEYERAVILAITAGGPEFSERYYEDFIPGLLDTGAAFYAMVVAPRPPDLSNYGQRNREMFVDAASRATGGARITLLTSMALPGALDRLADELISQYRITYGRPETLIPPKKIEVGVGRPGLTARGTPVKPGKK